MTKLRIAAIAAIAVLAVSVTGCYENQPTSQEKGAKVQESVMQKAIAAVPVPGINNFPTRRNIARYMEHDNKPDQTHYVYVYIPGIGPVGYFVADSAPTNICTGMTPPQRLTRVDMGSYNGEIPMASPGLDGVYYGNSGCDKWYFFDTVTGAKMEMGGNMAFFITSEPLALEVTRLTVKVQ